MKSFKPLIDKMQKLLPDFESKVLPFPFKRTGIWISEAFAVCALSSELGITHILESGVKYGRSTEMFARYGLSVTSVDLNYNDSMKRLKNFPNVSIKIGDGRKLLPILARDIPQKIGVFIDGPKGSGACKLARRMVRQPNVVFVGIHDMRTKNHMMNQYFPEVMYTDEPCFRDQFKHLDAEAMNTQMDKPLTPGGPEELPDPAGPTIGFVVK